MELITFIMEWDGTFSMLITDYNFIRALAIRKWVYKMQPTEIQSTLDPVNGSDNGVMFVIIK